MRGNYASSTRLADEALEIGRSTHGSNTLEAWLGNRLVCAWDHGQLGDFAEVVSSTVADYASRSTWDVFAAFCHLAAGQAGPARSLLDTVVRDDGVAVDDDSLWAAGLAILVEMAQALPDRRAGARLASATRPYADRMVVCGLARATLGPIGAVRRCRRAPRGRPGRRRRAPGPGGAAMPRPPRASAPRADPARPRPGFRSSGTRRRCRPCLRGPGRGTGDCRRPRRDARGSGDRRAPLIPAPQSPQVPLP